MVFCYWEGMMVVMEINWQRPSEGLQDHDHRDVGVLHTAPFSEVTD